MKVQETQRKAALGNYNKHTSSVGMAEKMSPQEGLETEKDGSLHTGRGEAANTLTNCNV